MRQLTLWEAIQPDTRRIAALVVYASTTVQSTSDGSPVVEAKAVPVLSPSSGSLCDRSALHQTTGVATRRLYLETGWAERTIRARLHVLERLGIVGRPFGPRKGWASGPYATALRLA